MTRDARTGSTAPADSPRAATSRGTAGSGDAVGTLSTRTLADAGRYVVTETRGEESRTVHVGFDEVRAAKGVPANAGPALDAAVAERLARPRLDRAWAAEPAAGE